MGTNTNSFYFRVGHLEEVFAGGGRYAVMSGPICCHHSSHVFGVYQGHVEEEPFAAERAHENFQLLKMVKDNVSANLISIVYNERIYRRSAVADLARQKDTLSRLRLLNHFVDFQNKKKFDVWAINKAVKSLGSRPGDDSFMEILNDERVLLGLARTTYGITRIEEGALQVLDRALGFSVPSVEQLNTEIKV